MKEQVLSVELMRKVLNEIESESRHAYGFKYIHPTKLDINNLLRNKQIEKMANNLVRQLINSVK